MPEKVMPGPVSGTALVREAVCVHTKKIYDSCRDRDCIEDLRFYPSQSALPIIERALSVKPGCAELFHVYVNVEPVSFHKGCYSVDLRYYYRVTVNVYTGGPRPVEVSGICLFDKRVILYGGEGAAKIFSSKLGDEEGQFRPGRTNLPVAVVEAVDPILLDARLVDPCCECRDFDCGIDDIPVCVRQCFEEELVFTECGRRIYVTLGQFSLIRLERDTQLLIPAYDHCMPTKECTEQAGGTEDPCELFRKIQFPVEEFFPPEGSCDNGGCGCN